MAVLAAAGSLNLNTGLSPAGGWHIPARRFVYILHIAQPTLTNRLGNQCLQIQYCVFMRLNSSSSFSCLNLCEVTSVELILKHISVWLFLHCLAEIVSDKGKEQCRGEAGAEGSVDPSLKIWTNISMHFMLI